MAECNVSDRESVMGKGPDPFVPTPGKLSLTLNPHPRSLAKFARLTKAPLKLVRRESPASQIAEER